MIMIVWSLWSPLAYAEGIGKIMSFQTEAGRLYTIWGLKRAGGAVLWFVTDHGQVA
jgi:hypothetical protein